MSGFDINRPYRTRDGREAWATPTPNGFLCGYLKQPGGACYGELWLPNGLAVGEQAMSSRDLVNIPEKRTVTVWFLVNPDGSLHGYPVHQSDPSVGPRFQQFSREITYEIGEGL